MREALIKCYKEVAEFFDGFVKENGVTDKIYSKAEIEKMLKDKGIELDTFFLPSDMFYNHTTRQLGESDYGFKEQIHLFEWLGRNMYRILGSNYAYTGNIYRTRKIDRKEVIVGKWENGKLVKWDDKMLLDD